MPIGSFQSLDQEASHDVPNADALIQGAGGNELRIGGNGNGGYTILNRKSEGVSALLNIPQTYGPVATTRRNSTTVAGKVERVDILLVAREVVTNGSGSDIPHLKMENKVSV